MANLAPQEVLERVRTLAQRSGAAEAEAYMEIANVTEARVRQGEVEFVTQSAVQGVGVRVFVESKVGFSFTTDLRPTVLDELVRRTIILAGENASRDENRLPDEQPVPLSDLEIYDESVAALRTPDLIALARKSEEHAFATDKRVQLTRLSRAGAAVGEVHFTNSYIPYQSFRTTTCWGGVSAIATDGTTRREGTFEDRRRSLLDLNTPERIGRKAAERAVAGLGGRAIPTTTAPVIFEAEAAGRLLAGLIPALSAENVLEQRSFLVGKVNQAVASRLLTIVDDGLLRRGLGTRPFDGEGIQQRRTVLVDHGRLVKYFHTAATARRMNTRPSGNANRTYQSLPAVGPTNLYIEPGSTTLDKMIATTPRGLLVTGLAGFGFDTVSGGYSQQVVGRWIEQGAIGAAVEGVTVAGNLAAMLIGIDAVGRDLEYRDTVSAPSIRIRELTIAGA